MHRFYQPDIASTLTLSDNESRHAVKVLRLGEGDLIEVVDGTGWCHRLRIALAHPKHCGLELVESLHMPNSWGHQIVLAIAPTKHLDRIEWAVEKCTEMGLDRFVPLQSHNSERTTIKIERLQRVMVAAMKQSLGAVLPQCQAMTQVTQVIASPFAGQRFIAYCDALLPREQRRSLASQYRPGSDVQVLIGPEGDFSPQEVDAALSAGFVPVTLGPQRLRTETAAVVACATIHALDQQSTDNKCSESSEKTTHRTP